MSNKKTMQKHWQTGKGIIASRLKRSIKENIKFKFIEVQMWSTFWLLIGHKKVQYVYKRQNQNISLVLKIWKGGGNNNLHIKSMINAEVEKANQTV